MAASCCIGILRFAQNDTAEQDAGRATAQLSAYAVFIPMRAFDDDGDGRRGDPEP